MTSFNLREETNPTTEEDVFIQKIIDLKRSGGEVSLEAKVEFRELILSQFEDGFRDTSYGPEASDCLIKTAKNPPSQNDSFAKYKSAFIFSALGFIAGQVISTSIDTSLSYFCDYKKNYLTNLVFIAPQIFLGVNGWNLGINNFDYFVTVEEFYNSASNCLIGEYNSSE